MADDLGYNGVSFNGQTKYQTPNIDRIAQEGMIFTNHYAGSTVCGPSRAALLSGNHTGHTAIRENRSWISTEEPVPFPNNDENSALRLQKAGYQTAVIGKWGLSDWGPEYQANRQGFDYFFGYKGHGEAHHYYPEYLWRNDEKEPLEGNVPSKKIGKYTSDLFAAESLQFIEKASKTESPFFLYLAFTIPHLELTVPAESKAPFLNLGKPLFDIKETIFPQDAMTGEQPSPTQPIPQKPAPFTRQTFTEKDINPWASNRAAIAARLRTARTGSLYTPLTSEMTVFFPGTDGGAQWGGAATDLQGVLYVPAKENPCYSSLVIRKQPVTASVTSTQLYGLHCASCHGADRRGSHDGAYPSLLEIGKRLPQAEIQKVLKNGRGMMPSFSHLSNEEHKALLDYLLDENSPVKTVSNTQTSEVPHQHTGYNRWYDADGYPVSAPPWGTLTAIDLNTGERRWQVPLGEYPELTQRGISPTGTDNYGGPLVTGSGLIFIAASKDEKLRAMDKKTGKTLWQTQLPAAGYASPATYSVQGKQYVVITCGGGKLNTKSGDQYVAFCLNP